MAVSTQNLIAARFAQTEVLVATSRQELFEGYIRALATHERIEEMLSPELSANDNFWPEPGDWKAAYRPYVVENGVLKIPVMGVLLNRFGFALGRYATGYTYIQKAVERGMADPGVKGIAFICDSPGGEVAGCFELTDMIYGARREKPMRAFAVDYAYSAAFSVASAAHKISMTRSGGVGSVGVVTAHVDYSKMLNDFGIKVTFIFAGKHKVDGNAYEKLAPSVKARIQEKIDRIYGVFAVTVARNRKMEEQAVRDTEALTYDATTAIDVGFADKVGVFEDEITAFADELNTDRSEPTMAGATEQNTDKGVPQATHDAAVAASRAEGEKAGVTAERLRINSILGSDEAKTRPKAALSAALKTDMTVDQAKAFLADLPEEAKAEAPKGDGKDGKGGNSFAEHMDRTEHPEVGAGSGGENGKGQGGDAEVATILGDYGQASGYKRKQAA
jgi:signal peptide peptidase SppA